MIIGRRIPIKIAPGTNPTPDATALETLQYTDTKNVRFYRGKLRKYGGNISVVPENDQVLLGCARNVYSYNSLGKNRVIIGTNTRLYVYQDEYYYNITPLDTATTAAANSLATNYGTLVNNPMTTAVGTKNVTVAHTAHNLRERDLVTISGVTGNPGGIPNAEFNAEQTVIATTANTYTFSVATTNATSTATGGGASCVEATSIITVTIPAHGLPEGDRIALNAASATGGIPAGEINAEHVIRNVTTNTFDIVCDTYATSSVSSGGGAATTYQVQIEKGECDGAFPEGFGGGLFGEGEFGSAISTGEGFRYPRIWSMDRFGNDIVMTPGNGGGVYIWDNDVTVAPSLLTNAPAAADWVYVSANSVVVLYGNSITASSAGDATDWDFPPNGTGYYDELEGVGSLISQAAVQGINMHFCKDQILTFRDVGAPNLWESADLMKSDGLIAPKARAQVDNAVFWCGHHDFYMYDGTGITRLPNNTVREYFYNNLNVGQVWKIFCDTREQFGEVWWWAPSVDSSEPDFGVCYNYLEQHWTVGHMARTAAEEPSHILPTPYMINSVSETEEGTLYLHEYGVDDDGEAMDCYAISNYTNIGEGDSKMRITRIVPDSTQTGNIDIEIRMKNSAQSSIEDVHGPYEITETTEWIDVRAQGRQRQYKISQNALGEDFIMGHWTEVVQEVQAR